MDNYYVDYVRALDIVFLVLAASLVILVFGYAVFQQIRGAVRQKRLRKILENLQKTALPDKELSKKQCSLFVRNVDFRQMLDVYKDKKGGLPEELLSAMARCIERPEEIAKIEKTARRSLNKWKRIEALIMLGHINSPNAPEILKKGAMSKDDDISYFSIVSLGHIKTEDAASILFELLKQRKISGYRVSDMLQGFPADIANEVFKHLEYKDPVTRFWAIKVLAHFKPENKEYRDRIAKMTEDASDDVRSAACEFLGEMGDAAYADTVRKCLVDPAWTARNSAVIALEKLSGEACVVDVLSLIEDDAPPVRNSVKIVASKHIDNTLDLIEKYLRKDEISIRKDSVEILEESGYDIKMLDDVISEDSRIRERATGLLDAMIKAGAHFGLESDLESFPDEKRDKILEVISSIDKDLAEHIKLKLTGRITEM